MDELIEQLLAIHVKGRNATFSIQLGTNGKQDKHVHSLTTIANILYEYRSNMIKRQSVPCIISFSLTQNLHASVTDIFSFLNVDAASESFFSFNCEDSKNTYYNAITEIQSAILYNWVLVYYFYAVSLEKPGSPLIIENEEQQDEQSLMKMLADDHEMIEDNLLSALFNYQYLLDELYFAYTVENIHDSVPDLMLMRIKNAQRDISDKLITKEHAFKLSPHLPITLKDEHIICAMLGLNLSFVDYFEKLDLEVRYHEPLVYWVTNFISYMYDSETEEVDFAKSFIPDENIFRSMQFTNNRALMLKQWIETKDADHYQNVFYWVNNYIEDIFSHYVLMTDALRFPWSEKIDKWNIRLVPMERESYLNEKQSLIAKVNIHYCNIVHKNIENMTHWNSGYFPPKSDESFSIFFHGTNHEGVINIISNGINIEFGNKEQDFSHNKGLYVSYDFIDAVKWAKKKSSRPAVIIFKVKKEFLNAYKVLDLQNNNNLWQKVVCFNRTGCKRKNRELVDYENYRKFQCIVGPRCKNPKDAEFYSKLICYDGKDSTQLCIVCEELAWTFGNLNNVDSVLFF